MSRIASVRHHLHEHYILTLSAIAITHRACILISLLYLQPLVLPTSSHFDTSASLLDLPQWILPLVRWDILHYTSISVHGYRYEQELAFLPGWPAAMRGLIAGWRWFSGVKGEGYGMVEGLLVGVILSNAAAVVSTVLLYKIILQLSSPPNPSQVDRKPSKSPRNHTSRDLAFVASLLHILSPSPATIASGYTEPLFAALTFGGILCLVNLTNTPHLGSWRKVLYGIGATVGFAGATSLRSLGVLSAGMVGWLGVVIPVWMLLLEGSQGNLISLVGTMIPSAISCLIIVSPFLIIQYVAYRDFCLATEDAAIRPWCHARLPFAYGFVQNEYWDVGFLRYWTPAQIPNFVFAMPVICVCLVGCWEGVKEVWRFWFLNAVAKGSSRQSKSKSETSQDISSDNNFPFQNIAAQPIFLPLLITHSLTTFILLFNSHVQIALRVAQTMPVLWMVVGGWGLDAVNGDKGGSAKTRKAGLRRANWGRWWITWSVIWHCAGLVLWGAFLPPA